MEISSFAERTPRGEQGKRVLPYSIAQGRTDEIIAYATCAPRAEGRENVLPAQLRNTMQKKRNIYFSVDCPENICYNDFYSGCDDIRKTKRRQKRAGMKERTLARAVIYFQSIPENCNYSACGFIVTEYGH